MRRREFITLPGGAAMRRSAIISQGEAASTPRLTYR